MEFHLFYEGRLPAAGSGSRRAKEKQAVRRALHPQLRDLWETHPELRGNQTKGSGAKLSVIVPHLADQYTRCGSRFVPLVNSYFQATCSIDILFLRREAPFDMVNGGDLDNRLKVLFDGLRMPVNCDELAGDTLTNEDPFFCLLEDDRLIAQFQVTTDRLLQPRKDNQAKNDVVLIIKVVTSSLRPGGIGSIP